MKLDTRFGKPQTWLRPLALLVIVAMLVGSLGSGVAAAAPAPVMSAESKTAFVGDTFDLTISIKDVTDLSAFQFSLDYDPQIVEVLGVTLQPFLTSTLRPLGGQVGPTIDPIAGTLTYGAYTVGAAPAGPSAGATPQALAKVSMKALKSGYSSANLFNLTASNTAGAPQSPIGQGGLITIADQPAPATIIAAPNLIVGVGGDFAVAVTIENSVDLAAYQFTLGYDPTVLEFVKAENSSYLISTGRPLGGLVGPMGPAGSVTFGAFTTGAAPAGPSNAGPNTLAVLTFHTKKVGVSPLTLSGMLVSDTAGITRLAGKSDGSVQVKQPVMSVDSLCTVERVEGEPFVVPVMIDHAADMSAFQFKVNWNPALFKLLDVQLGDFLLSTGRILGGEVESEGLGTLTYGAYTIGGAPAGPSGAGVLANLTFVPLTTGSGSFDLVVSSVSNTLGDNFTTLRSDGCARAVEARPAVELTKTVGVEPNVCATTDYIELAPGGGTVYYCYTITNLGNISLTEHDLVDSELGVLLDGFAYSLPPGESVNQIVEATVAETTKNTAVLNASNPFASDLLGKEIAADGADVAEVFVADPKVELVKTVGTEPGVCATTDYIELAPGGGAVYYCYTISNTGNVPLTEHDLVDSELGVLVDGLAYDLLPGESVNQIVEATVAETTKNTATWTASNPDLGAQLGGEIMAEGADMAEVFVADPKVELVKTVGTEPGVCATTDEIMLADGGTVYYCYTITNTGNVSLTEHDLVDSELGLLVDGLAYDLLPGESVSQIFEATVAGTTINTATWMASNPDMSAQLGGEVKAEDTDMAEVFVTVREVELVKTVGTEPGVCATTDYIELAPGGGTVYYCYTLTNLGNVPLTEHDLVDSELGVLLDGLAYDLLPGESVSQIFEATISKTTKNEAVWTAANPDLSAQLGVEIKAQDADSAEVLVADPKVELVKTVGTEPGACATTDYIMLAPGGGTVYYCYTITNTGNVPLTEHDLVDSELGVLLDGLAYDLLPGESVNQIFEATVTKTTKNTATWTASSPDWSPDRGARLGGEIVAEDVDMAEVFVADPKVELVKTVGTEPGVCATTDEIILAPGGGTVYYCYTLTNTGNVPLTEHDLVDVALGALLDGLAYDLLPGESVSQIFEALVTETSLNTATWTASNPDLGAQLGGEISANSSDLALVFVVNPQIALFKTVGTEPGVCAETDMVVLPVGGGTVYYCYTLINTGNVALTEHDLVDSELGVLLDGLVYDLLPGESVNQIVESEVTETTENTATWTAYAPDLTAQLGVGIMAEDIDVAMVVIETPTAVTLSGFATDSNSATSMPLAAIMLVLLAPVAVVGRTAVRARRRTW